MFDFFAKRQNLVGTSDSEQFDSAAIVDTVSTTSAEESVSLNTEAEVASACVSSVSSVSIHNQLQPRDPLHGKQAALEFFKDGPFPVSYTHLDVYKRQPLACNGQLLFHTHYCFLLVDCSAHLHPQELKFN